MAAQGSVALVDREVLLPLQKTLALPSFSHHVAALLRIITQLQLTEILMDKLEILSRAAALVFLARARHFQTRSENWVGVQEEQREKKGSWQDTLRQKRVNIPDKVDAVCGDKQDGDGEALYTLHRTDFGVGGWRTLL